MVLSSLTFLLFFLPLTLLLFALVPAHFRVFVLVVASLLFIGTTSPLSLALLCASLLMDYLLSRPIFMRHGQQASRWLLYLATAKNILLVVGLSVADQLHTSGQISLQLPTLGVTVCSFTSLGYLIDLYNGETDPITSVYDYFLFCSFFGKIHVGPIVSSRDFAPQLRDLRISWAGVSDGCVWFCHGLAKKLILADSVLLLGDQLKAIPYTQKTVAGVWLLVLCYLFATYFTLSGYSDMARGLGAFFGLNLPENFHYPLQSQSVTDFFSNFNISANRFVRKYVYQALGAEDNGTLATTINIMLITMLMGLWYGISLNLLVWGSLLGCFIVMETLVGDRLLRIPALLRRIGTLSLVVLSFSLFCSGSLSQAWFYLQVMFGLGGAPLYNSQLLYLLIPNLALLLLCTLFSTNFFTRRGRMLQYRFPWLGGVFSLVSNLAIFVVSLAYLVAGGVA